MSAIDPATEAARQANEAVAAYQLQQRRAASISRLTKNELGRPIVIPSSSGAGRQALCQQLYEGIMDSIVLDDKPESDLNSYLYRSKFKDFPTTRLPYATSMIQSFKTGLAASLDKWIDQYNAGYTAETGMQPHDHAAMSRLTYKGTVDLSINWPEVSTQMSFEESSDVACPRCVAAKVDVDRADTMKSMTVTMNLTRKEHRWAVDWHVQQGTDDDDTFTLVCGDYVRRGA